MTNLNRTLALIALMLLTASPALAGDGHHRAHVNKTQDGRYRALVEHVNGDGQVDDTTKVGTYGSKKKARKAARKATKKANQENGVKGGDPICDQPNVYC